MARKITKFEASDYLDSPEVIAAYITEAFETGDSAFIAMAFDDVAKAKEKTKVEPPRR
jgi:probable addiction module antidote protein